jgi:hypothetical protein
MELSPTSKAEYFSTNRRRRTQMKKIGSFGLLVLVLVLVVTVTVACGTKEETTTTVAAVTETTVAGPTTTVAGVAGIAFEAKPNNVVYITDSPEPGMAFPISTSGDYVSKIWAVDASGAKVADLTTTDGMVDYSSVVGKAVKIMVEGPATTGPTGATGEWVIPK